MIATLATVSAAAVGAPDAAAQAPAAKMSRDWKRARSTNFVAVGNADEGSLSGVLKDLEAFRWAFAQMFPTIRLSSSVPTIVVVFDDWNSFTRFQPRDGNGKRQELVVGYFSPAADVNYMVMGAQGEGSEFARTTVFHEFTHYILRRNLHTLPTWLSEGLSEYYGTLKIDKNRIVIGAAPQYRLSALYRTQLLPFEKMLSEQGSIKLLQDERDALKFYAQSWALVHYVTIGNQGKRRGQFSAYMNALERGQSVEEAFRSAFACSYEELERELSAYIHAFSFPTISAPVPANVSAELGRAERMTEDEAQSVQADLLVRAGAREDADKTLAALLGRDPSLVAPRLSLALLRLGQDRSADAAEILRGLVKADASNFPAHVYLAAALVEAGQPTEAVSAADRATRLNAESVQAWSSLALAAVLADDPARADAAMASLLRLDPNPGHYQTRAYAAFRAGKEAAAARDANAFLDRAGWKNESAPYVAFLGALAHRRLAQPADADRLLDRARSVVERGSWTQKVLDFFQGRLPPDQFLQAAKEDGEKTEAHTYIGFQDALAGRRDQAIAHFRWVKERGSKNYVEYPLAVAELARLEKKASGNQ